MSDFLQELEQFKSQVDLVLKKKHNYIRPIRQFVYYDYLSGNSPVGKELLHFFNVLPKWDKPSEDYLVVIHGHEKNMPCATSYFCHEYKWRPDRSIHNPSFVAMFNQKWKSLYETL